MANRIYIDGNDIKFEDGVQTTARSLDSIVKGDNSAHASRHAIAGADTITELGTHKTRHQDAGADEISLAGLSGEPADTVNKTGAQTVAGVKTLSDNLVFSGDKIIQTNVKASAYLSADQLNITSASFIKVLLNTELYDIGADFATDTNRFVAPINGYYQICASVGWKHNTVVAAKRYGTLVYKNGAMLFYSNFHASHTAELIVPTSKSVYLLANDYIELLVYHEAGVNTVDIDGGTPDKTFMTIHLLSV